MTALAEILSVKHLTDGTSRYYVHYIDYNKRLDEWVEPDRLDLTQVQMPKGEGKTSNVSNTNHVTPLRNGSRSCSPERELITPCTVSHIFENCFHCFV